MPGVKRCHDESDNEEVLEESDMEHSTEEESGSSDHTESEESSGWCLE